MSQASALIDRIVRQRRPWQDGGFRGHTVLTPKAFVAPLAGEESANDCRWLLRYQSRWRKLDDVAASRNHWDNMGSDRPRRSAVRRAGQTPGSEV